MESYITKSKKEILQLKSFPVDEEKEMPLFVYPLLEHTGIVKHAFTTRLGGCSEEHLSSLNLSFTRGDKKEAVEENYRRLAAAMGVEYGSFVFSQQTHTTNVLKVGKEDIGNGLIYEQKYTDIDGLITNESGVTLVTFYADCVPLYFVDPVHKAIGLSHSGWRGTVNRMGKVTLEAMHQEFGTQPEDVVCAIGPSICQDCYEISEDVAIEFQKEFAGREKEILLDKKNGKYQLDLWKANEIILLEAGIKPENLAVTNICTCCNPKVFYSHRASKGQRGNLAAVMALKE
ncbi:MAG: peptidoglycan editing factor PgeF [Lachnospiraceae bacterium]|nr:peptidoglycan editing factor PgeF [Lachnospiraceae bacterium]